MALAQNLPRKHLEGEVQVCRLKSHCQLLCNSKPHHPRAVQVLKNIYRDIHPMSLLQAIPAKTAPTGPQAVHNKMRICYRLLSTPRIPSWQMTFSYLQRFLFFFKSLWHHSIKNEVKLGEAPWKINQKPRVRDWELSEAREIWCTRREAAALYLAQICWCLISPSPGYTQHLCRAWHRNQGFNSCFCRGSPTRPLDNAQKSRFSTKRQVCNAAQLSCSCSWPESCFTRIILRQGTGISTEE